MTRSVDALAEVLIEVGRWTADSAARWINEHAPVRLTADQRQVVWDRLRRTQAEIAEGRLVVEDAVAYVSAAIGRIRRDDARAERRARAAQEGLAGVKRASPLPPDRIAAAKEVLVRVVRQVRELPPPQDFVLAQRVFFETPYERIAELLGMPADRRTQKFLADAARRARAAVRSKWDSEVGAA